MQFTSAKHKSQVKRAARNTFKYLLKLGHNCSVKAFIANQLRHWHSWLKIRRRYMDLRLDGIEKISIRLLARLAGAHRKTVRACMRSKIPTSDIIQALKHWSRLRLKAWSGFNYGVEQAKLDTNYLYCETVVSREQANKKEVIGLFKKARYVEKIERLARKTKENFEDLALRASGMLHLSDAQDSACR